VPRLQKTLAAIAVLSLVVLAGCSGGDDDDDAAPTTAAAGAGGPTTTVRPVDTSFSGQNSAQFCALARTYSERANAFGSNPTPAQLRTATREGQTAITQAVNAAPAEIKPELEKVNFEPARMPPAALQPLQTPEFQQSTTRFQAYGRSVCGIN